MTEGEEVNYNPLDKKPKIHFEGFDWAVLIICSISWIFVMIQLARWVT